MTSDTEIIAGRRYRVRAEHEAELEPPPRGRVFTAVRRIFLADHWEFHPGDGDDVLCALPECMEPVADGAGGESAPACELPPVWIITYPAGRFADDGVKMVNRYFTSEADARAFTKGWHPDRRPTFHRLGPDLPTRVEPGEYELEHEKWL